MAKKKKEPEPMPATEDAAKPPRSGSRHKPRKMVALPPRLYRQIQLLAERNGRPIHWEVRRALEAHCRSNGLWPPADASDTDAEETSSPPPSE